MLVLTLVGGAERSEGKATTVQVPAGRARFVIGRDPACDWALPDRTLALSARHCEIVRSEQGVALRDLSTNGTFVNRSPQRMEGEYRLREGDVIEAGPYVIGVSMHAAASSPAPAPAPILATAKAPVPSLPASAAAGKTVEDTTPLVMPLARGGDPAAQLQPMAEDDDALGLTRIRPVPSPAGGAAPARGGAAPSMPAVPSTPPMAPAAAEAPAATAVVEPAEVAAAKPPAWPRETGAAPPSTVPADAQVPASGAAGLAATLGLPAEALAGLSDAEQAARVGALLRAAVDLLRVQLARQARVRAALGSRRAGALSSQRSPLQMAPDANQALRWLLAGDPVVLLEQIAEQLAEHDDRLLAAFDGAAAGIAADLAPQSLARAVPGADAAAREALYAALWQRLGLAEAGDDWEAGLRAAARQHLARAYDDGAA